MILRPYQTKAIDRVRSALRTGARSVCMVAPCGAGKTILAASIIMSAYRRGKRCLFFAARRELIYQSRAKLIEAGVPERDVGIMMANDPLANAAAPIQVASIQTWVRRAAPPADVVFVDECHGALSAGYQRAIAHYRASGAVIIGLTATPFRANGDGLGDAFETLEVVAQPSELIALGHVAEPVIYAAKERADLSHVRTVAGDYSEHDLGLAMDRSELIDGIVANWHRYAEGRPTIAFAVTVAHSKSIADAFASHGIRAVHVDANTPKQERDAAFRGLSDGTMQIVSQVGIAVEGWDCPAAKCAVHARPTRSLGLWIQTAGRVCRPYLDIAPIILDHAGNAARHGFPTEDREFTLEKREKRKAQGVAPIKECPDCGMVVVVGTMTCPHCGYIWQGKALVCDPESDAEMMRLDAKAARQAGPPSRAQMAAFRRLQLRAPSSFAEAQKVIAVTAMAGWRPPRWALERYGLHGHG